MDELVRNATARLLDSGNVAALIAALFGFGGIAAGAAGIAKILFVIFLVLFVISLVAGRGWV